MSTSNDRALESFKFWRSKSYKGKQITREVACGLIAQEDQESSFDWTAVGDHGEAFSCFQWHPVRAKAIKAGCGIDVMDVKHLNHDLALQAAWWELTHDEHHALDMIVATKTAYDAGAAGATYFERPEAKTEPELRGNKAMYWLEYFDKNYPSL
jgi:hypothetical protein